MKKKLAVLLSAALITSMLAVGCGKKDEAPAETQTPAASQAPVEQQETPIAEGELKTGLYVTSSLGKSVDAKDTDGLAQADSSVFAVTVDSEGKVVNCVIDAVQSKVNFSAEGKIVTDLATEYETKNELGEAYGMKKVSSIGKEWNEQAQAFADYCVGKTLEEIKGIALTENGTAEDADLAAGVTVYTGDFINGVAAAIENADSLGAKAGDKLGLGIETTIANSKDGQAQVDSNYAVTTVNAEGTITSCILDSSECKVAFDEKGAITTDLTAEVPTKNTIGDAYGMKKASPIGKEWNEQAAAFAAYCTGKTAEEVNGIALTEGVPSDADLTASVTIRVNNFMEVITKSAANAK